MSSDCKIRLEWVPEAYSETDPKAVDGRGERIRPSFSPLYSDSNSKKTRGTMGHVAGNRKQRKAL